MENLLGLKQLDEAIMQPKGTAFRLFKSNVENLQEGVDFKLLEADSNKEIIASLKSDGRVYRQSHNVVLLSKECFERLKNQWISTNSK